MTGTAADSCLDSQAGHKKALGMEQVLKSQSLPSGISPLTAPFFYASPNSSTNLGLSV